MLEWETPICNWRAFGAKVDVNFYFLFRLSGMEAAGRPTD